MKAQQVDNEAHLDEPTDSHETNNKTNTATKLERRRRIEDLDEERRLRAELGEF